MGNQKTKLTLEAASPAPPATRTAPSRAEATASPQDPDALFAAGHYQAALKAFAKTKTKLIGFTPTEAKAFRLIDQAACQLRLGETSLAWDLHVEASNVIGLTGNIFNGYAWRLHEQGNNAKARLIAECGLDAHWEDNNAMIANTLATALDALGDTAELIPVLAIHQIADPDFDESQPLFDRHRQALANLWKQPTPSQEEALRRHFRRLTVSSHDSLARAIKALLAHDLEAWAPEVLAAIERAPLWSTTVEVATVITDKPTAHRALRILLEHWVTDEITQYGAKEALRSLVLGFFDDSPDLAPDLARALKAAHRKAPHNWPFKAGTPLPALKKKLVFLHQALLGQKPATPGKKAAKPVRKAAAKKPAGNKVAAKKPAGSKTAAKKATTSKARGR